MDYLIIAPIALVVSIFLFVLWGIWYNKYLRKKGELVVLKKFENVTSLDVKINRGKYKFIRVFVDYSINGFKKTSQKLQISLVDSINNSTENKELFAHNRSDLNSIDFGQLSLYTKGTEIVKFNTLLDKDYILKLVLDPKTNYNIIKTVEVRGYLS